MDDNILKFGIIILYISIVTLVGSLSGGKQRTVKDYFLGSTSVPWYVVCFSIIAAETSTLTFISIPGLAYATNCNFLQLTLGYFIGRVIVAIFFLPSYFKGELTTAYGFLDSRFGSKTRSFASITFIFTRIAADGVRLFATSIPIKLLLGIDYSYAIIIIVAITLIYTYFGGVKGVIWVDAMQTFIYLGAAVLSIILLLHAIPNGWHAIFQNPEVTQKLSVINLGFGNSFTGFFHQPYTLLGGIIGGIFLSMASHGTDQLIVQRLLATQKLRSAQKAIIGSGILIILQFAIFLFLGVLLFAFYGKLQIRSDEIFPMFIIQKLPPVASGIIIAGLLAAALSTLSSSINAMASSFVMDLYIPFSRKNYSQEILLRISRYITILWAVLLAGSAMFFMNSPRVVVELALGIASFTYGGLLGTFLLGLINKRATQEDALAGFTAGIFVMIAVISSGIMAWTFYTVTGVITTVAIGSLLSFLGKRELIK